LLHVIVNKIQFKLTNIVYKIICEFEFGLQISMDPFHGMMMCKSSKVKFLSSDCSNHYQSLSLYFFFSTGGFIDMF